MRGEAGPLRRRARSLPDRLSPGTRLPPPCETSRGAVSDGLKLRGIWRGRGSRDKGASRGPSKRRNNNVSRVSEPVATAFESPRSGVQGLDPGDPKGLDSPPRSQAGGLSVAQVRTMELQSNGRLRRDRRALGHPELRLAFAETLVKVPRRSPLAIAGGGGPARLPHHPHGANRPPRAVWCSSVAITSRA